MKKLLLFFIGFLTLSIALAQPKTEVRAVWLSSNYRLDFPKTTTIDGQKRELQLLLNKLQSININTVIFQVQCRSDVFWESSYQPWSHYITGEAGKKPGYDLLQHVIDECHARGMELHAWIVPYHVGGSTVVNNYPETHVSVTHPNLCVFHPNTDKGEWYLDPGFPETTEYLINLYSELVEKYDVDGINLDYTRYPDSSFPDDASYNLHGNGMSKADWRRQNINNFVGELYKMIKEKKPDMKLGAAPIGAYERVSDDTAAGWYGYSAVYQDAVQWMTDGNLDLNVPQVYWTTNYSSQMKNWIRKSNNRITVAGLAVYKMLTSGDGGENWSAQTILNQISQAREYGADGVCFFRTQQITDNTKNILDQLKEEEYFKYPANLPSMEWYGVTKPDAPQNVSIDLKEGTTYTINWDTPETEENAPVKYYCVYTSTSPNIDIEDVKNLAAHYVTGNSIEYTIQDPDPTIDYYFTVTAFDKGYYESDPSDIVSVEGKIVSIKETTLAAQFSQTENELNIQSELAITNVQIYSVNGILIHNENYNTTHANIDISSLNHGIYIVTVQLENGNKIQRKLIK